MLNASRTSGDDVKQITGNANLEPQSEAEARGRALERVRAPKGNMIYNKRNPEILSPADLGAAPKEFS